MCFWKHNHPNFNTSLKFNLKTNASSRILNSRLTWRILTQTTANSLKISARVHVTTNIAACGPGASEPPAQGELLLEVYKKSFKLQGIFVLNRLASTYTTKQCQTALP